MADAFDPADVLRRFFATLSTGDYAAIGEFFGDDSVWETNNVAAGHPGACGRRAIIDDFLQPVRDGLFEPGDPKVEVVRMVCDGDWVAAQTIARGSLRNGNSYENSYAWFAQIAGDEVRFLKEYMDTSYAFEISKPVAGQAAADEHTAEQLRRLGHEA
jgi:ketosteroid isomerase-like protein